MIYRATLAILGLSALCAGCQTTTANLTPQQVGALVCVLASDGATVTAIYKPEVAPKASASSQVACDGATQVGSILGAPK